MQDIRNTTLGELAAKDYAYARIFKKFGLDFCCGGGQTIANACTAGGVVESELIEELENLELISNKNSIAADDVDLHQLIDHIESRHHTYVRENLPVLLGFAQKVASVHGKAHPNTLVICELFEELTADLSQHLLKEEQVLFPYIRQIAGPEPKGAQVQCGHVSAPIAAMHNEHDHAGHSMKRIRELTNDYQPPEGACNTFRALYAGLAEFEEDLHLHIHLENNILFRKVLDMVP
jgi:regulator of cell morphogenesis and NO signaling